jgi:hypothetical protein
MMMQTMQCIRGGENTGERLGVYKDELIGVVQEIRPQ